MRDEGLELPNFCVQSTYLNQLNYVQVDMNKRFEPSSSSKSIVGLIIIWVAFNFFYFLFFFKHELHNSMVKTFTKLSLSYFLKIKKKIDISIYSKKS